MIDTFETTNQTLGINTSPCKMSSYLKGVLHRMYRREPFILRSRTNRSNTQTFHVFKESKLPWMEDYEEKLNKY